MNNLYARFNTPGSECPDKAPCLEILGTVTNEFAAQEPGGNKDITERWATGHLGVNPIDDPPEAKYQVPNEWTLFSPFFSTNFRIVNTSGSKEAHSRTFALKDPQLDDLVAIDAPLNQSYTLESQTKGNPSVKNEALSKLWIWLKCRTNSIKTDTTWNFGTYFIVRDNEIARFDQASSGMPFETMSFPNSLNATLTKFIMSKGKNDVIPVCETSQISNASGAPFPIGWTWKNQSHSCTCMDGTTPQLKCTE